MHLDTKYLHRKSLKKIFAQMEDKEKEAGTCMEVGGGEDQGLYHSYKMKCREKIQSVNNQMVAVLERVQPGNPDVIELLEILEKSTVLWIEVT